MLSITRVNFLLLSAMILICAVSSAAQEPDTREGRLLQQRQAKASQLRPPEKHGLESALFEIKDRRLIERYQAGYKGFHPMLGGLSTGSGFALGAQYLRSGFANNSLDFSASGQASFVGYQRYRLGLSAPRLADRHLALSFDFTQNNAPQEDFYGVGAGSLESARANYRLETTEYAVKAGVRPVTHVELGVLGGFFNTNVGHGTDSRFPSVEEVFSPVNAPGVNHQPHYRYAGGYAGFDSRDAPLNPRSGGNYQVEGRYYMDHDLEAFSFRLWRAEVQQYFPFFNERRVIAFRGRVELTDSNSDQAVPFYLLPVLGGSEDLRGYREFRFRDSNSVVANLEYRWEAFSGLDLAVFGDAGNVFPEARDLDLADLKTSYGFGLRFNTARSVFMRIDFGFGGESTRTFFKFNHVF